MKTIFLFFSVMFSVLFSKAQNVEVEAVKENEPLGDARYSALAGAVGAFGGNFFTTLQNPAGLAFCKNEATLSPFVKVKRSHAQMLKNESVDEKWTNGIGSIGFVYGLNPRGNSGARKKGQWSNMNFGAGLVRAADFNEQLLAEGVNEKNSLLDAFLEEANFKEGLSPDKLDPLGAGLAFATMVIDTFPRQFQYDSVKYFSLIPFAGELQSFARERSGKTQGLLFSFAATYGKKISLGVCLARQNVMFREHIVYKEADQSKDVIPYFNSFIYEKMRLVVGKGFSLRGGAIYQISPFVFLGIAGQTPMFMNMVEVKTARMESSISDRELEAESAELVKNYRISTPSKAIASIAISNQKKTFGLNFDYEAVDHQSLRVRTPDVAFDQNREIATALKSTANARIGLEAKIRKIALRCGVAAHGNPLAGNPFIQMKWNDNLGDNLTQNLKTFEKTTFACGLGLADIFKPKQSVSRKQGIEYFLDLSFAVTKINNPLFSLYRLEAGDAPKVNSIGMERRVLMTLGARF